MSRAKPRPPPPMAPPVARLVFEDGPRQGTVFPIILKETLVGRIASAELVLDAPSVSRLHARLTIDVSGVWLEDLDSREGTWINGVAIRCRTLLNDGDRICFGDAVLRFEI